MDTEGHGCVREGWAVAIRRKDGSKFLALTGIGIARAVWPLSARKNAVHHKKTLRAHGMNARVVRVAYSDPEIIPAKR